MHRADNRLPIAIRGIDRLEPPPGVANRALGDLRLRGKGADLALYALTRAPQRAHRAEATVSRDAAPEERRVALL